MWCSRERWSSKLMSQIFFYQNQHGVRVHPASQGERSDEVFHAPRQYQHTPATVDDFQHQRSTPVGGEDFRVGPARVYEHQQRKFEMGNCTSHKLCYLSDTHGFPSGQG